MIQVVSMIIVVIVALAIVVYATWLLGHRLRTGAPKAKSFREWISHILQAIWGL
jgi:hypothetical protein